MWQGSIPMVPKDPSVEDQAAPLGKGASAYTSCHHTAHQRGSCHRVLQARQRPHFMGKKDKAEHRHAA